MATTSPTSELSSFSLKMRGSRKTSRIVSPSSSACFLVAITSLITSLARNPASPDRPTGSAGWLLGCTNGWLLGCTNGWLLGCTN